MRGETGRLPAEHRITSNESRLYSNAESQIRFYIADNPQKAEKISVISGLQKIKKL